MSTDEIRTALMMAITELVIVLGLSIYVLIVSTVLK